MNYKLSPSDLTFLYDGCKRCFVLKVKHGISQPSIPFPPIVSKIGSLQKEYYSGKRTEEINPGLPPGEIIYGEKQIRSRTIELIGLSSTCFINGRFDIVAKLDDGSYGVLDFKTGNPSADKSGIYARQLHAYAIALENPAPGALNLTPVSKLGLVYFTPDSCEKSGDNRQNLTGSIQWIEIERNDEGFMNFIKEVISILDGSFPEPQSDCKWCSFLTQTSKIQAMSGTEDSREGIQPTTPLCPKCNGPMQLKSGKYGNFWSCMRFPDCKGTRDA